MKKRVLGNALLTGIIMFAATFTACTKDDSTTGTVTGVSLDKIALTLEVGTSETLVASVQPADATDRIVTWASSSTAIASVSNGTVTAIAVGTATITAKAGNKTATCTVTVTERRIEVTGIALNKTALTLEVGATETLTAVVSPDNATDKSVTWTSNNTDVATVDGNGAVMAITAGTATITAQSGNKTASCVVTAISLTTDEGVVINGVTWATRNVDAPGTFAATPESYGMFYQWNRKIGWSSTDPMVNSNGGTTWDYSLPSGTEWESDNDPSPAGWRVPTLAEIQTLFNTDKVSKYQSYNGVNGWIFIDKTTDKKLFLPVAGYRSIRDGSLRQADTTSYYWGSSTYQYDTGCCAWSLSLYSIGATVSDINRMYGFLVRCVRE